MTNLPPCDPPLDLLVVAPHPDDAEISVGGTILVAKRDGLRVGVVDLTSGEPTPHGTPELRAAETAAATRVLGLDWRTNLGLPNRSLVADLDARTRLAEVFRTTRPRIVLAPYWEDAHPDHVAASRLVDDARFTAKLTKTDMAGDPFYPPRLFYFWSVHLRIHPRPSFVVDVSDVFERRMEAVRCFESQFVTGRPTEFPTLLDDVRDRCRYWGWTIHTAFAEPFCNREEMGLSGLASLLP